VRAPPELSSGPAAAGSESPEPELELELPESAGGLSDPELSEPGLEPESASASESESESEPESEPERFAPESSAPESSAPESSTLVVVAPFGVSEPAATETAPFVSALGSSLEFGGVGVLVVESASESPELFASARLSGDSATTPVGRSASLPGLLHTDAAARPTDGKRTS
jgi:hypothetical protein